MLAFKKANQVQLAIIIRPVLYHASEIAYDRR